MICQATTFQVIFLIVQEMMHPTVKTVATMSVDATMMDAMAVTGAMDVMDGMAAMDVMAAMDGIAIAKGEVVVDLLDLLVPLVLRAARAIRGHRDLLVR